MKGLPIVGTTKIPPCGAINVQPNIITNAPLNADPITHDGITLNGSLAANGIAPSVINDKPKIIFVSPDFLSPSVNFRLKKSVAIEIINGGGIPPAIDAAIK